MKNWLKNVLFAGFLAVHGPVQAARAADPAPMPAHGVHGMLVFGDGSRLFASHLPLYRHPHDWQVVLELVFPATPEQTELRQRLQAGELLTLEPERFDLLRLRPGVDDPLPRFTATLFQGHFERGGRAWLNQSWQVKQTLVFEPVGLAQAPVGHRYFVIGANSAQQTGWLLHRVERRPDTDQVLRIRPKQGLGGELHSNGLLDLDSTDARIVVDQVLWQDSDDLQ